MANKISFAQLAKTSFAKKYAQSKYDESYGYQVIIECFGPINLLYLVDGCETSDEVKVAVDEYAAWKTEAYEEVQDC